MRAVAIMLILLASFVPLAADGQEQAPLQVDVRVRVTNKPDGTASFRRFLEGGAATVRGNVHTLPGGETAFVLLQFNYRSHAGLALDEIISQIEHGDDIFGSTVQLAARLCSHAEPSQILVSNVVAELCLGKGLAFRALGEVALKGFERPVQVHAVEWPVEATAS